MILTGREQVLVTGVSPTGGLASTQEPVSTADIAGLATPSTFPRVIPGTTGSLAASDNGKLIQCTSGSSVTLTVPAGLGSFQCLVVQMGTGVVTPTTDGTTVINGLSGKVATSGQYAEISLISVSADHFVVGGAAA